MKIAITGCNGSLGKVVVRQALDQGHAVVGIDRVPEVGQSSPEFSFLHADLTHYEQTIDALRGCEAVIHLAALPHPNDYKVMAHNKYGPEPIISSRYLSPEPRSILSHSNVVVSWNVLRAVAELGITRVAQASSVNVVTLVYSQKPQFDYLPLDEDHPCLPDEPYGLSKVICELQADTIVRRYPHIRIASIRPHWCVPSRSEALERLKSSDINNAHMTNDLWGYVREDCVAKAFLLALKQDSAWSGHEAFFIVAPDTILDESEPQRQKFWSHVPVKEGKDFSGRKGFFDCSKAEKMLGWVHPPDEA